MMLLRTGCACLVFAVWPGVVGTARGQEPSALDAVAGLERLLVDVIGRAEKSVVAIARVRRDQPGETFRLEFRPDPFGRTSPVPGRPEPGDPDFIPDEYGTGVVVDRQGLILTAYHVLGQDSEYYVRTHDRRTYRARIKGADPRSDLAVLQIDALDLVPIRFGDAERLKKGQIVVALGNPYAIARDGQVSASWGIVSNLARKAPPVPGPSGSSSKPTLHHFGTLIQTDAKLNLGTSGGPLLDRRGEMIGLTVALAASAGYETPAGYAIPVDATFRRVVRTLKEGREVEYGLLGVQPSNLRAQEVLQGLRGARVDRVVPGTPAARYDLRPDDIVTAVDGHPVYEADSLVLQLGRLPVESVARLSLIRAGRRRTLDVTLSKYPVRGRKVVTNPAPAWRGLRVDYPTALVDSDARGDAAAAFLGDSVIVVEVTEDTPASQAGLQPGMRISHVGTTAVRTPREFRAAVAGKPGPVTLRLAGDERDAVRVIVPGS